MSFFSSAARLPGHLRALEFKADILPPLIFLLGLYLLVAGYATAIWVGHRKIPTVYFYYVWLWMGAITATLLYLLRPRLGWRDATKPLFILSLFTLLLFRFNFLWHHSIHIQTAGVIGSALFIWGLLRWRAMHPRLEKLAAQLRRICAIPTRSFIAVTTKAMLFMTLVLAWYCFEFQPAIMDSTAQYIHAKYMAQGLVYGITHPMSEFFPIWMAVNNGKFFAQYQPLHVFLLSLGHRLSAPWIVNPACSALTLAVIYFLARQVFRESTARLAVLLTLGCQFILFMSAEYMNHSSTLLFTALFMLCFVHTHKACLRGEKKSASRWGFATGLSAGAVMLIRPFTAAGIALPFCLYAIYLLKKDVRRYRAPFAWASAAGLICLIIQSWFNFETSSDIFMFPSAKYHYGLSSAALGIGKGALSPSHILSKAHTEWWSVNQDLFEWPVPSLLFVAAYFLLPVKNGYALLMLASFFSHTIINFANQFSNYTFGPRYMFETSAGLIILTAAGIQRIPLLMRVLHIRMPRLRVVHGILALLIMVYFATAARLPLQDNLRRFSNSYVDNNPAFYHSLLAQAEAPALIFVGRKTTDGKPPTEKLLKDDSIAAYRQVSFTFPPSPDDPVIFAFDRGDKANKKLIDYFPDRNVYVEYNGKLTLVDVEALYAPAPPAPPEPEPAP
jgi:hypothetical protein